MFFISQKNSWYCYKREIRENEIIKVGPRPITRRIIKWIADTWRLEMKREKMWGGWVWERRKGAKRQERGRWGWGNETRPKMWCGRWDWWNPMTHPWSRISLTGLHFLFLFFLLVMLYWWIFFFLKINWGVLQRCKIFWTFRLNLSYLDVLCTQNLLCIQPHRIITKPLREKKTELLPVFF